MSTTDRTIVPIIEAYGTIRNGVVEFQRSWTYDGNPIDTATGDVQRRLEVNDAEPIEMALVGVEGTAIEETTVPDRAKPTHGDETFHGFMISLPFPQSGIWLDASYGGGDPTRLNAIVHPVQDAVGRVPDHGLVDPETSRQQLIETLGVANEAMHAERFGLAASTLQDEFSTVVSERVTAYESLANEPTADQLLELAERQGARLTNL